jgi:hypothetical protein
VKPVDEGVSLQKPPALLIHEPVDLAAGRHLPQIVQHRQGLDHRSDTGDFDNKDALVHG